LAEGPDPLSRVVDFLETHNGQRLVIALFSIVATLVLYLAPGTGAAIAIGLPYAFFIPGFAVVRMFFWKGTSIEAKFVLSLGLSVLAVIFLGLFLVLTPIGLDPDTSRISLIVFALGAVAAEIIKNRNAEEEKPEESEDKKEDIEPFKFDKVVAAMIGTALIVSVICLGLIITADYPSRTYFAMTEDGSAKINTTRTLGSNMTLTIEMHNGEDGPREFMMVAYCMNSTHWGYTWSNRSMAEGDTWETNVTFHLDQDGIWRFDFDLYIQEVGHDPYLYANLHVWVSID
jgi:uncharacterized membrane protein